jgi:hypothetical protein
VKRREACRVGLVGVGSLCDELDDIVEIAARCRVVESGPPERVGRRLLRHARHSAPVYALNRSIGVSRVLVEQMFG